MCRGIPRTLITTSARPPRAAIRRRRGEPSGAKSGKWGGEGVGCLGRFWAGVVWFVWVKKEKIVGLKKQIDIEFCLLVWRNDLPQSFVFGCLKKP